MEDYFAQGCSSISDPELKPRGQRRAKEGLTEEMKERNESEVLLFRRRRSFVHLSNQISEIFENKLKLIDPRLFCQCRIFCFGPLTTVC